MHVAREAHTVSGMLARTAGRLGLLLLSVGLVLAGAELVLRSRPARNDAVLRNGTLKYRFNPYARDRMLAYALRPNWETVHSTEDFSVSVRTNSLGMRSAARADPPAGDPLRILFAGDSYTFGFGVEGPESFPERVGVLLGEALRRPIEVLNAGVPGWSADQHMLYLHERGLTLEPDLLIVQIMQNDVSDLRWHRLRLDDEGLPLAIQSERNAIDHHGRLRWLESKAGVHFPLPESPWLAAHSQLYHWIRLRLMRLWLRYADPSPAGAPPADLSKPIAELSAEHIQRGIESSAEFRLRYHRHLLAAIERDAAAHGVPLRFVLIGHGGAEYAQMRQDCAARPNCLDTTDLFAGRPDLTFPTDGHWTAAGHDRAARAIATWLLHGALPEGWLRDAPPEGRRNEAEAPPSAGSDRRGTSG